MISIRFQLTTSREDAKTTQEAVESSKFSPLYITRGPMATNKIKREIQADKTKR